MAEKAVARQQKQLCLIGCNNQYNGIYKGQKIYKECLLCHIEAQKSQLLIQPSKYADGSFGYDSNSLYDQALLDTQAYDPAAYNKYQSFFDTSVGNNTTTLPTGNPSAGGGGGNNAIDPNMVNIERMREERAREAQRQADAVATQNYLDDSQMSFSDPRKSPGHPSNYNYTPSSPAYQPSLTGTTMDDTAAIQAGMQPQLSSRLDSKGYTPTNVSKPIDQIMEEYLAKQAGK